MGWQISVWQMSEKKSWQMSQKYLGRCHKKWGGRCPDGMCTNTVSPWPWSRVLATRRFIGGRSAPFLVNASPPSTPGDTSAIAVKLEPQGNLSSRFSWCAELFLSLLFHHAWACPSRSVECGVAMPLCYARPIFGLAGRNVTLYRSNVPYRAELNFWKRALLSREGLITRSSLSKLLPLVFSCPGSSIPDLGQWVSEWVPL